MPNTALVPYPPNLCSCGHDYQQHNIAGNTCLGCPGTNAHKFAPDSQIVSSGPFAADQPPNYVVAQPVPNNQTAVGAKTSTLVVPPVTNGQTGFKIAGPAFTPGMVLLVSSNNAATQEMAIVVSCTAAICTVASPLLSAHANGDNVIQVGLPLAPAGANQANGQRAG